MMSLTHNKTIDKAEKFKNNSFGVLVEDSEDASINADTHADCQCALHNTMNHLHEAPTTNKKNNPNQRQRKRRWEAKAALHTHGSAWHG